MRSFLATLAIISLPLALIYLVETYAVSAWHYISSLALDALYAIFDTAIFLTIILN